MGIRKMTQLHWAACAGHSSLLRKLLQSRSDASAVDEVGRTAIHWAASNNNTECLRTLLEHGGNATIACDKGNTAYHYAARVNSSDSISVLLGLSSVATEEIINQLNNNGESPIYIAASAGNSETVFLLSERYANVNIIGPGGNSVLHKALLSQCSFDAIQSLVEHNANLLLENEAGDFPLHFACKSDNQIDIVLWLLTQPSKYESVSHQNALGATPLHIAASYGSVMIVNALLQNGSDPSIKDVNGATPYDIAEMRGNQSCVELLAGKNTPLVSESDDWLKME